MTNYSSYHLICAVREGDIKKTLALISTLGLSYSEAGGYTLLRDALQNEHTKIAKILLEHGSRVNSKTKRQTDTPLHFAVKNKDAEIVAMLLDREAYVNVRNDVGQMPLHLSIKKNNSRIVSLLLNKNADVNAKNNSGETPLFCAICEGDVEIVELLRRSSKGMDALHIAAEFGTAKVLEYLLDSGALVDIVCEKTGYTPLHRACAKNRVEIVQLLLKRGADINARTKKQSTALHLAAEVESDKIVKVLLEHDGVDIDAEDDRGKTVLIIALERSHLQTIKNILAICPQLNNEKHRHSIRDYLCRPGKKGCRSSIVKTLLSHGFGVYLEDANDRKLLHFAVEEGCTKIVEDLLRYGADVDALHMQKKGYTLLHNAAFNMQHDIAEMLIKHGADVNAIDETGKSVMSYAVGRIDAKMTKLLVSNGAEIKFNPDMLHLGVNSDAKEIIEMMLDHDVDCDIMAKGTYGQTALWNVFRNSLNWDGRTNKCRIEQDLAELLLSRGAKVNEKNNREESLLHIAVRTERNDMVEILLRHNADVNVATKDNMKTPLHYSADGINEQISRMLLDSGAAIDAEAEFGNTALHYACKHDKEKIVDTLLEFGAEIDHKDSEDSTPLHVAALNGSLKVVETLLKSCADVECTDKDGKTALHVASKHGLPKIVEELLDYGADPNVTCKKGHSPIDHAKFRLFDHEDRAERDFHFEYNEFDYDIDDDYRYHYGYDLSVQSDFYSADYYKPPTADAIKQHIIKIETLNIQDRERNLESEELDDEFEDFQAECECEVELMKSERIGEANISYYDVLMKSMNQLAMLARNEDIVEVLESSEYREKFSLYYKMLYYKFKKGQNREKLLNASLESLNFIFPLPELVSLKLLDQLSNKDLKNLIKSVHETESR